MTVIIDKPVKNIFLRYTIILAAVILALYILLYSLIIHVSAIVTDSDPKSLTPIKHIIVISQGKRSFDNYFGMFPGANGLPTNLTVPLNPFPPPVVKFTVAAWFNTNNTLTKNGFLVNKGGIGVDTPGKNLNYGIWMNNKGKIIAGFETKNGTDFIVGSNNTYNDGLWHNVVVTYNGNLELNLFIDGALSGVTKTGGAIPDSEVTQPIRIGANSLSPDNFFTGRIDEVRIWNRALTSSEILKGYNSNAFDPDEQLVYLPFKDTGKKNEGNNNNTIASEPTLRLNGIYLNGSLYQDVKANALQYTKYVKPFHLQKTKTEAPYDGTKAYQISYNKGQMNGFAFAQLLNKYDPDLVMGYYDHEQLPYYWQLASQFVLADNFFAPSMETGLGAHQYLYTAASTEYQKNVSFRGLINLNRTIFDELQSGGLSWRVYVQNYDPALNYTNPDLSKNRYINLLPAIPRFVDNKTLNSNIVDLIKYFRDLRSDEFPAVSYIVAQTSDESSPRDVSAGQEFVSSLVLALMKSKQWNNTAFIITYREPGGWYDHVAPPVIDGHQYGFRVPTLIISPFAKKGYVDSTIYDVTSILKFIEYNYGLSPLSVRDAKANNILNAFDFTQPPRSPVILNSSNVQNTMQENQRNIDKDYTSIDKINLVYLVIISIIPVIGVIIWLLSYRRQSNLDFIQNK